MQNDQTVPIGPGSDEIAEQQRLLLLLLDMEV